MVLELLKLEATDPLDDEDMDEYEDDVDFTDLDDNEDYTDDGYDIDDLDNDENDDIDEEDDLDQDIHDDLEIELDDDDDMNDVLTYEEIGRNFSLVLSGKMAISEYVTFLEKNDAVLDDDDPSNDHYPDDILPMKNEKPKRELVDKFHKDLKHKLGQE